MEPPPQEKSSTVQDAAIVTETDDAATATASPMHVEDADIVAVPDQCVDEFECDASEPSRDPHDTVADGHVSGMLLLYDEGEEGESFQNGGERKDATASYLT